MAKYKHFDSKLYKKWVNQILYKQDLSQETLTTAFAKNFAHQTTSVARMKLGNSVGDQRHKLMAMVSKCLRCKWGLWWFVVCLVHHIAMVASGRHWTDRRRCRGNSITSCAQYLGVCEQNVTLLGTQFFPYIGHVLRAKRWLKTGITISHKVKLDVCFVVTSNWKETGQLTHIDIELWLRLLMSNNRSSAWLDQLQQSKCSTDAPAIIFSQRNKLTIENNRSQQSFCSHIKLIFPLRRWAIGTLLNRLMQARVSRLRFLIWRVRLARCAW